MAKKKYEYWISTEGLIKIEGGARDGLTDKQISHNIGVTEQTLNVWKNKYPSLFESLKRGKEVVDREVENALLKRALSYKYTEAGSGTPCKNYKTAKNKRINSKASNRRLCRVFIVFDKIHTPIKTNGQMQGFFK